LTHAHLKTALRWLIAQLRASLLWLIILVPLLLGIIAGLVVRASLVLWRALIEGYQLGRGPV
jgi:hypothetical protein